ncbi:hypothetical protein BS78_01G290000 [Paspalum vaginatum]|nr:hypothetical protein BS78_01G290000 [Paspalum vaginatum]
MDRHTCKLCFRRFHNGRALGGHMRSHVMAAAAAHSLSLASTSSTEMAGAKRRRLHADDGPESSGAAAASSSSSSVLLAQDGESDTEASSPRLAVVGRRRSERPARRRAPPGPPEQPAGSGVSDATPEAHVAMSLVMLSRDSWARPEPPRGGRHRCGVCGKVFRSYQALGGHRASVMRGKGVCVPAPAPPAPPSKSAPPAVHECPFCFRVFESGQALGGHKRAHTPSQQSPWPAARCGGESSGSIDLNTPAATADDDFELSAVYDAEVGSARQ